MTKRKIKKALKRFWKEWGISKEELGMFVGALSLFSGFFALYMVGCMF